MISLLRLGYVIVLEWRLEFILSNFVDGGIGILDHCSLALSAFNLHNDRCFNDDFRLFIIISLYLIID